ncbi:MAG: hypothetical protein QW035_01765 [Candidatus Anstonellales archaeon]
MAKTYSNLFAVLLLGVFLIPTISAAGVTCRMKYYDNTWKQWFVLPDSHAGNLNPVEDYRVTVECPDGVGGYKSCYTNGPLSFSTDNPNFVLTPYGLHSVYLGTPGQGLSDTVLTATGTLANGQTLECSASFLTKPTITYSPFPPDGALFVTGKLPYLVKLSSEIGAAQPSKYQLKCYYEYFDPAGNQIELTPTYTGGVYEKYLSANSYGTYTWYAVCEWKVGTMWYYLYKSWERDFTVVKPQKIPKVSEQPLQGYQSLDKQ